MAEGRRGRGRSAGDGLDADFGPGFEPAEEGSAEAASRSPRGPGAEGASEPRWTAEEAGRIPCGRDGCLLKPIGDLAARFAFELARRGHTESAARAATSGIELLKALRDFLDEEIALAERSAEARRPAARYTKIPVE
ncbi:MAG TPA: hypothetical protein P5164_10810 [Thermoanaerobaculia bacterium]|nr:hypothetical protein [Thermoanaerobaculia bacterium]